MSKKGVLGDSFSNKKRIDSSREYVEYQLKFPTTITETDILAAGAKRIASLIHDDKYYLQPNASTAFGPGLIRVRTENEHALNYSYKKELITERNTVRGAIVATLTDAEASNITSNYTHVLDLNKRRVVYVLGSVVINFDVVDPLGTFVELVVSRATDYEKLIKTAKILKLPLEQATSQTYFQLAYTKTDTMQRVMSAVTSHVSQFSASVILSVFFYLASCTALITANESKIAIISSIIAIGLADSITSSLRLYIADKRKNNQTPAFMIRNALFAFVGKLICAFTFVLPVAFMSSDYALQVTWIWGLFLLIVASLETYSPQNPHEKSIWNLIVSNLLIALIVIAMSFIAGNYLLRL